MIQAAVMDHLDYRDILVFINLLFNPDDQMNDHRDGQLAP
jgi:hypothetical protein